ncbi:hypothetical protein FK535_01790 [Mycolicibacterium sp. 018/SC-01/001]|uniref:hypothetical protein n=1 Tax=Mycolicibacterium sp. 018/SC-01/001 TaxID=2592069 RepID=UPI00117E405C|nr:hypothetical protein [Mycolicibacterium sp. 018/SC-01/001]TRW89023.1 hypothetical protein FK535_01790 [Mycolicibacterium sp. 018/SC-01/001]
MATTHLPGKHRLPSASAHTGPRFGLVSLVVAAGMAGWLFAVAGHDGSQAMTVSPLPAAQQTADAPQDIRRAGVVTAVSASSLTTVDANGQTTTFAITPETTQLHPGSAGFEPTQNVIVVGVVRDGVPVATVIAERGATDLAGQPMDYHLPQ